MVSPVTWNHRGVPRIPSCVRTYQKPLYPLYPMSVSLQIAPKYSSPPPGLCQLLVSHFMEYFEMDQDQCL